MSNAALLTDQFGSPLYVYNEATINDNISKLESAISYQQTQFFYAIKANTNLSILKIIKSRNFGADCVSIGELKTTIKVGFIPSKIRFTPSFADPSEVEFAFSQGIQVSVDSMHLVNWVLERFPAQSVGLRINPSVMAGAYVKTSTGHSKAKFGIGLQYIEELLSLVKSKALKVNGLHIHSGSDILDPAQFLEAVEVLLSVAPGFRDLEYLDLGSGFKVPYFEGDSETDLPKLGNLISKRITEFCNLFGRPIQLLFEPGKIVVSAAGQLLVTCTGIKENGGIHFAGVDSGFNHLIRPMFYGAYHTIRNLSNPNGELKKYDLVGNICETDTFASDRDLPEIRVGDVLCFENAGAYCFSMASSYNSRPRPAEVMLYRNGEVKLIRRRETVEDIWAGQL